MATTREAASALWRFCFDVDLNGVTEATRRPLDDPLPWMLADPRRLQRQVRDGVWIRVVDAAAALRQRTYAEPGALTIEVRDALCQWNNGCFRLEGDPEGAVCTAAAGSPDITLEVSALASAYLGTISLTSLHGAGLADEHTPGALNRADRMFAVPLRPLDPFQLLTATWIWPTPISHSHKRPSPSLKQGPESGGGGALHIDAKTTLETWRTRP